MFYSYELIDIFEMYFFALICILCLIALVVVRKKFQTTMAKTAITGIMFLSLSLYIRSLFNAYSIDLIVYDVRDRGEYLQYNIISGLFCVGAVLIGLAAVCKLVKMTSVKINRKSNPSSPINPIKHL
jgi:hypothetical protein